jgi:hypothetical protein
MSATPDSVRKVEDYGQRFQRTALDGYIARGDLARDLEAFFADCERSTLDVDAGTFAERVAALPEPHRAAVVALDALAQGGKLPESTTCNFTAYGFDTVKNELYGATDARYVGLASDESGSYQFLDVVTGAVLSYEHEGGIFEEERGFASLDEWAFTMMRVELVSQGRVAKADMRELFERLELTTGLHELEFWGHALK